jgi:RNA polymerase sigma factor (sigma-70 family)
MEVSPTHDEFPLDSPRQELDLPESVSRQIIASYRLKLEWILRLPEWEPLFAEGLDVLQMPGPRKGIGLRPALNALLIEHKFTLVRWAVQSYRGRFPSGHAERLSREFGLDLFNSLDLDADLSLNQWGAFQSALVFALAREHRRYKHAQAILFASYQGLIERTVNRIVFDPGKRHDCVQEGCLALLHAIDKVDDSDTSLGAYADMWIRRQVKNYLMGERFPVHVPINLASKTLRHASSSEEGNPRRKGGKSDPEVEKKVVILMEQLRQPSLSLNDIYEDSGPLSEQIADEDSPSPNAEIARKDLRELVATLIAGLTDKQREVLELRFGLNGQGPGKTLAEISREIGISHQQVSMREKRALQKLEDVLAPYLSEIFA